MMDSYDLLHLEWPKLEDLLTLCEQSGPCHFSDVVPLSVQQQCKKIGEGIFNDVYRTMVEEDSSVFKIMSVNTSPKESLDIKSCITEVFISKQLTKLKDGLENRCTNFCRLRRVHVVEGPYPLTLQKQWDAYKNKYGSMRHHPGVYPDDQLFICMEYDYGGTSLSFHPWNGAAEAVSVLKQAACGLAVAEQTLSFEHGDLHKGNILVQPTSEATVSFVLNSVPVTVETNGLKVSIIDFNLSRISEKDGHSRYADVPEYDIALGEWTKYAKNQRGDCFPCTNILWLRKLCENLVYVMSVTVPERSDPAYQQALQELTGINKSMVNYDSTTDFVKDFSSFR